jgi:hypothetical protein
VLAVVLSFSGGVSVIASLSVQEDAVTVYPARELWDMEGALQNVPVDAVLLAAPSYNHPLTYWGRIRVLGYEGHTWSHGIDSSAVAAQQARIFAGAPEWQALLQELGATHIVWGPHERQQYGDTSQPWRLALRNVSQVPEVEIYALD